MMPASQRSDRFHSRHAEAGVAPCYPRDIVNQVLWAARYEGKKPHIDHAAMAQAVEAYFLVKG